MAEPLTGTTPACELRRVLVTGASGFIARAVVRQLRAEQIGVATLDRATSPATPHAIDHVLDLVDADLEPVLDGVDAIIHLAGTPGVQSSWAEGFDLHVRNNLVATQRLCEAALSVGCRRLVLASSSSVYGSVPSGFVSEDHPVVPISPYGASKAATEHLAGAYAERGLAVTPLRYFTVYGPGQRPDMAIHRMFRAALGGPAFPLRGDGTQARSFTFVDDVARATVSAAQRTPDRVAAINIGGTDVVSVRELLCRVEAVTGRVVPLEHLPAAPGDPARTAADIGRAASLLRWAPTTPISEGLVRQWDWHRSLAPVSGHSAGALA